MMLLSMVVSMCVTVGEQTSCQFEVYRNETYQSEASCSAVGQDRMIRMKQDFTDKYPDSPVYVSSECGDEEKINHMVAAVSDYAQGLGAAYWIVREK
jgi:hypothetical protein